jgi:hypothetical protein
LTSNIKSLLEGLNKKELIEIANQKKISIPKNWSKSLMVELLALNVTINNVQQIETYLFLQIQNWE